MQLTTESEIFSNMVAVNYHVSEQEEVPPLPSWTRPR